MSALYDQVASDYDDSFKLLPIRMYVEVFSVLRRFGDLSGLSVLDIGCGTGFYCRALRRAGATRVLGVDLSPEMIRVAQSIEVASPMGVEFRTADALALGDLGQFDLALGVHLLHYAPTREKLAVMCREVIRNLKPGGRFVAFFVNPDLATEGGAYTKYGINVRVPSAPADEDGCAVHFSVRLGEMTTPEFTISRFRRSTLEQALGEAGFRDFKWELPEVAPDGMQRYGAEYWAEYLARPNWALLQCWKRT